MHQARAVIGGQQMAGIFLVDILPDPVNCFTLHFVIFIFIFISLCRLCLGILDSPAPQLVQSSRCECSLSLCDDGRPNSILAHLDIFVFRFLFPTPFPDMRHPRHCLKFSYLYFSLHT